MTSSPAPGSPAADPCCLEPTAAPPEATDAALDTVPATGTAPTVDTETDTARRGRAARSRGAVGIGGLLAVLAVGTIALNLRPGATSLGPVMEPLIAFYGQGGLATGVLTALPCLAFGLLGMIAVPAGRRLGLTGTLLLAFGLVVIGLLLRPTVSSFGAFLALSALGLIGPALGNVLVPAWVKLHGGTRVVGLMTLYTVMLAIGGTAGASFAAPLAGEGGERWQLSLQTWGLLALLPVVIWAIVLTRTRHDYPPPPPDGAVRGSLWRSPTAIALTVMFGLQSMNAYTQFGMLPQILTESGVSAATAGAVVGSISAWGILGGLIMPTIVARSRHLPLICISFGVLTTIGYLGLLLAPTLSPFLWAAVLGAAGLAFPTAIAMIPARTRSVLVTARLSGMTQPVGYVLAAIGPILIGALMEATGSAAVMLLLMAGSGVLLGIFGGLAGRHRMVDDEIAPRAAVAPGQGPEGAR